MTNSKPTISKDITISLQIEIDKNNNQEAVEEKHEFVLSEKEAKAASPADIAVCGEEDPGEALEFLITDDKKKI